MLAPMPGAFVTPGLLKTMSSAQPLHPLGPARDGGEPGAGDLDQAERLHQGDELLDLDCSPVISKTKCSGRWRR